MKLQQESPWGDETLRYVELNGAIVHDFATREYFAPTTHFEEDRLRIRTCPMGADCPLLRLSTQNKGSNNARATYQTNQNAATETYLNLPGWLKSPETKFMHNPWSVESTGVEGKAPQIAPNVSTWLGPIVFKPVPNPYASAKTGDGHALRMKLTEEAQTVTDKSERVTSWLQKSVHAPTSPFETLTWASNHSVFSPSGDDQVGNAFAPPTTVWPSKRPAGDQAIRRGFDHEAAGRFNASSVFANPSIGVPRASKAEVQPAVRVPGDPLQGVGLSGLSVSGAGFGARSLAVPRSSKAEAQPAVVVSNDPLQGAALPGISIFGSEIKFRFGPNSAVGPDAGRPAGVPGGTGDKWG